MKKIEKERMWIAATILAGMCGNYHNGLYPETDARVRTAILMADTLIKALNDPEHISHCAELYQRKDI